MKFNSQAFKRAPFVQKTIFCAVFITLLLCFSYVALKWLPNPFVWIGTFLFLECLFAFKFSSPKWRLLPLYFGFLVLPVTVFEYYLGHQAEGTKFAISQSGSYLQGYFVKDEVLGFGPVRDKEVVSIKSINDKLLYDVKYTILKNGLRKAHTIETKNNEMGDNDANTKDKNTQEDCVLFFGCSMLFGEGLNDEQTLPYLVGQKLNIDTHNFAFHGYGAHQMLANVTHHLVEEKTHKCRPKMSVYMAIPNHLSRSRGMSTWDLHGPRFEMSEDNPNEVIQFGHFDDHRILPHAIYMQLSRSHIFSKLFVFRKMNDKDMKTYLAMVKTTQEKLKALNPEQNFVVILWNAASTEAYFVNEFEEIKTGLQNLGIKTLLVSDILKGYPQEELKYVLHEADRHPNALANQLIAEALLR